MARHAGPRPWAVALVTAAIGAGTSACGASNTNHAEMVEVLPAPVAAPAEEVVTSEAILELETLALDCPTVLAAVRERGLTITYAVVEDPMATLQISPSPEGDGSAIGYAYELRDERGREAGVETYVCEAQGLALTGSGPADRRVTFDPPVPVLPLVAESGSVAGTAVLTSPDGEFRWEYRFEFDAADVEADGPLAHHEGRRRNVRSVLLLNGDAAPSAWASDTTWLVSDDALFVTRRVQESEMGAATATVRTEEARTVTEPR